MIGWIILVQDLYDEIATSKVGYGTGQSRPTPHESEEEGAFLIREVFHHLPEPLYERGAAVDT